jgi:hypothetical protein
MKTDHANPGSALRCWAEGRRIGFELGDQRIIRFPAEKFPLRAAASTAELAEVRLRVQGRALRWESVDEDILIEDVLPGRFPRTRALTS